MTTTDPKSIWWIWRATQERLTTFALALVSPLRGRRFSVVFEAHGTGYFDPKRGVIKVNPVMFPEQSAQQQFRLTQGLLGHEAGHALFTGAWPAVQNDVLCQLVNILEDQRIEWCLSRFYPGLTPALRLLGDLCWAEFSSKPQAPEWQAFECCLAWRWACDRADEPTMFAHLGVETAGQTLWQAIRPRVESAWQALSTAEVIERATEILQVLGLPPSFPPLTRLERWVSQHGVPRERIREPFTAEGPHPDSQPGLGEAGPSPTQVAEDEFLHPKPYLDLEEAAKPLARQLADALRLPTPDAALSPHAWRGRYTFRQELRTPETPHLYAQTLALAPRSLAIYLLVDRSGSMSHDDEHVQLALMTLYLAVTDLGIPLGLTAFGANEDEDEHALTFEVVAPMSPHATEGAKALIAGYHGKTSSEFLNWGLAKAEQALLQRPERLRVVVVIHDGQPLYYGKLGEDWKLSVQRIKRMETTGLIVIGVYLGERSKDVTRLKQLFRWLIKCTNEQLPERLGDLLRTFA